MRRRRPQGVTVVALLMIVFGLAEIMTGFRHGFFGISAGDSMAAAVGGIVIGALYAASGPSFSR